MIADREERYCPRKTRKDAKGREDRAREIHERTRKKKDSFFTFLIFRVFRGQCLLFLFFESFVCFVDNVFLLETVGAEFLAFEHLDGEGDGVDLVVVVGVGEC